MTLDNSTAALLVYLEEIYRAAMTRNASHLDALHLRPTATHLPHEVRAEALAIVVSPAGSLRAPIRMLQLQQRIAQLAVTTEDDDDTQLELELRAAASGTTRQETASRRARR